ncbi:MAG: hypothetical protein V4610_06605 [Pseudomonadota bacterium]
MSIGCASAQAQEAPPAAAGHSDIIVTGRRPLNAPGSVEDRYAADSIRTLGAMTIGEVIERLERRNGGRPFSIIVNGRRLADVSDLRDVPPEALAEIQILSNRSAGNYGFTPENKVLNLVLKPRFASTTADLGVRLPTEGGGEDATAALRHVKIDHERHFNASVSLQGNTGLDGRDRLALLEGGANDVLTPYRTLLPSSRTASLTAGLALPLGSTSVTISSALSDALSRQLARFMLVEPGEGNVGIGGNATQSITARGVIDASRTRFYQIGLSASGALKRITWTGELTGSVTVSRTGSRLSRQEITGLSADGDLAALPASYVPLAISSRSGTLGGALSANASLVSLPAGDLTANMRLSGSLQRLVSTNGGIQPSRQVAEQGRYRGHLGFDVPLVGPGVPLGGFLGRVALSASVDSEWVSSAGRYPGYDASVEWQPVDFLSLSLGRSRTEAPPVLNRSRDAIVYTPGVLVVDALTGDYVLVTRISGGETRLRAVSEDISTARLSLGKAVGSTNISTTTEYISSRIANPVVYTGYASALFQRVFPGRFIRDGAGQLVSIDVRPFNASEERRNILKSNLHLTGVVGATGDGAPALADSRAITWDFSLTHEWTLQDTLSPSAGAAGIDLLKTPLDGVQGTPRHRINIEVDASYRAFTFQVGARWRSGARVEDISALAPYSIRYAAFGTADAGMSWTLPQKDSKPGRSKPLRLWLTVENLFDKRFSVRDSNGQVPAAFSPAFLDPTGRVIVIRASRAL